MDAILITGPTASGKSALAVELAKRHGGEVINADSMQVYGVLDIVTARPRPDELGGVPHHLYGVVSPDQVFSTGAWLRLVEPLIAEIRARGRVPVVVGGTGLYFKALEGGLSAMPDIPAGIRERWRAGLAEGGPEALHRALAEIDPDVAGTLSAADGQRLARALEVKEATGRSIRAFQLTRGPSLIEADAALRIIIEPERPVLHARINRRFEAMMDEGAVEEVEALAAYQLAAAMPAMKAIGVAQILDMLAGRASRAEAIERASAATRQYAKRQSTWFRNQMGEDWRRIRHADEVICG